MTLEPRTIPDPHGGEYGTPQLGGAWPLLSWLCFVGALASRFVVALLPRAYRPWPWRLLLPGMAAIAFALFGVLFGIAAWHGRRGRRGSKLPLAVNAVALAIGLLLAGAFFWILP